MRYLQYTGERYNFLKILCVSDVYSVFYSSSRVWVFCLFFVSWQGRQYYILVPRGRVLSLLIKRRFIIKCSFSFCPLEIIFFFNSNHTQITGFIHTVVVSSLDAVFVKLRLLRVFCYRGFFSQGK